MAHRRPQAVQLRKRLRRLPPAPEPPPDGYMWAGEGSQLLSVAFVERLMRKMYERI